MTGRRSASLAVIAACVSSLALAQPADPPLVNWTAPLYWTPTAASQQERPLDHGTDVQALGVEAMRLPSAPVPFVAIAPCRIVDTRVYNTDGFHFPNFSNNEDRTYTLPASTGCPGLPTNSVAYSLNVQFRPIWFAGYITLYPAGMSRPATSILVGYPQGWTADAAIVAAGTSGAIDVYCQSAGRVVIDINGYYLPENVVNTLNTLAGDVILSAGSNVTITSSGNTLTIAATGGPGGSLPAGSLGQTLYNDGSAWEASNALTNDGTNVGVSGNLSLPGTASGGGAGVLLLGGAPFLHNYGPANAGNTFVGQEAGNFTMGGVGPGDGGNNTAFGYQSLSSTTTGYANTANGWHSLFSNTSGYFNTASGVGSLQANTTGTWNTASGLGSLDDNTTGCANTATGNAAGYTNITGSTNSFFGAYSNAISGDLTDATAIGAGAIVDDSYHVRIGDTRVTQIGGQVGWSALSDARHKENIRDLDLDLGLDFVLQLRPVSFTMKQGNGRTDLGFLAQDVEAVLGDGYSVLAIGSDPDRTLSLRYTDLIAPLVKAVQEQHALIEVKDARIAALERQQVAQQTEIDGLKSALAERDRSLEGRLEALEQSRR